MPRALKVYAWVGWETNSIRTHETVAAHSAAEVARLAGVRSPSRLWNLGVTANPEEVAKALSEPGVVFWHRADEHIGPHHWRRRAPGTFGRPYR